MFWLTIFLIIFSLVAMILPLVPSHYWLFRAFDYPRVQILVIQFGTIILIAAQFTIAFWTMLLMILLLSNCGLLLSRILPYTIFGKQQVKTYTSATAPSYKVSLLHWNVYQHNQRAADFLEAVENEHPDIILLCETNQWWVDQLQVLHKDYPERKEIPLENTYGMCFYSKLPIKEIEIVYLLDASVPSIHATVQVKDRLIRLYGVHPIPPIPQYSTSTVPRDAELLIVAKKVRMSNLPSIVLGDLNDVAWSDLTLLFQKVSRLLDARRGRGILPTFPVQMPLLYVPIDQVFCSPSFQIINIKRLAALGSDHFPLFVSLALVDLSQSTPLEMSKLEEEDKKTVRLKIQQGHKLVEEQ